MSRIWLLLLSLGLLASLAILGARGESAQAQTPAQLQRGEYMFVERCKPCHGDVGQGLALWRKEWAPEDQNCGQPKCHGLSHPPDGFYMPKDAPPIIGPNTLMPFRTARDLFAYISKLMPFDKPGELSQEDYWAVTAYLLNQNHLLPAGVTVDDRNAETLVLRPQAPQPADSFVVAVGGLAVAGAAALAWLLHSRRK